MLRIISLAVLTLISEYSFSQTVATSKRRTTPVTVDGSAQEWSTPFGLYETTTKLMFAIANDSTNLYLCFQCPDMVNQDKIMRAGMKLSLIQKGKNKINASIVFPLKKTDQEMKEEEGYVERQTTIREIKAAFLLNNFTMLTDGFVTQNGALPLKNNAGIQVAMNWDSTLTLNYELAIPFKEFFGSEYTAEQLAKELILTVEIYPIARPASQTDNITGLDGNNAASVVNGGGMQNYGSGNMPGGGMNSMQGSGMQNGYPGNSMAGMSGMQDNTGSWDGSTTTPQHTDISGAFEKADMKQKFLLSVIP